MNRSYDINLIEQMNKNTKVLNFDDLKVRVKPVADTKEAGMIDQRIYKEVKRMALARFIPKRLMKIRMNQKMIETMRRPFNDVVSLAMVESELTIDTIYVKRDQVDLRMMVVRKDETIQNAPILYFLHGGGFFAGKSEVIMEALKLLADQFEVVIFSFDYRLAPENPYPTGHQDAYFGLKWVLQHAKEYGGDKTSVVISGDSAGGNLAQYCTNQALKEGLNNIIGQILLYPTINMGQVTDEFSDVDFSHLKIYPKHKKVAESAIRIMKESIDMLAPILGVNDFLNPDLTPYMAVRSDLPKTLITVGELDGLRQESLAYGRKLQAFKNEVEVVLYRGIGHAFLDKMGILPQAEDFVNEMGQFILERSENDSLVTP